MPSVLRRSRHTRISPLSLHDALPISQFREVELGRQIDQHAELPIGGPGGESLLLLAGQLVAIPRPASGEGHAQGDRKSTRLNSSYPTISYAVVCWEIKNSMKNTCF